MTLWLLLWALADPGGGYRGSCERRVGSPQCVEVERKHATLYLCKGICYYPGRADGGLFNEQVRAEADSERACVAKLTCRAP